MADAPKTRASATPKPEKSTPAPDKNDNVIVVNLSDEKSNVDTPENPPAAVVVENTETVDDDVEAMGRRGRKSKAEIAAENKNIRDSLMVIYGNKIAFETHKAHIFREELKKELKDLGF